MGLGNLNVVNCIPLYLMIYLYVILRDSQNNLTNNGSRPFFVLSLSKTICIRDLFKMIKAQETRVSDHFEAE